MLVNLDSTAGTLNSRGPNRLYKFAVSGKGKSEEDGVFSIHTPLSAL